MSEAVDRSGMRRAAAVCAFLVPVLCVLWNLDMPQRLGRAFLSEQYLAVILGLTLGACFFGIAQTERRGWTAALAALGAVAGLAAAIWSAVEYKWIIAELAYRPAILTLLGVILLALVLEGLRRQAGLTMFLLVATFLVYALVAHLVPGALAGPADALGPAGAVRRLRPLGGVLRAADHWRDGDRAVRVLRQRAVPGRRRRVLHRSGAGAHRPGAGRLGQDRGGGLGAVRIDLRQRRLERRDDRRGDDPADAARRLPRARRRRHRGGGLDRRAACAADPRGRGLPDGRVPRDPLHGRRGRRHACRR